MDDVLRYILNSRKVCFFAAKSDDYDDKKDLQNSFPKQNNLQTLAD